MKRLLSIGGILLLLLPAILNQVTWVSFFVNQSEIIALFCENKDKPALQCNGKCHLAKTLQQQQPESADEPIANPLESLPYLFYSTRQDDGTRLEEPRTLAQSKVQDWWPSLHVDIILPPPKGLQD